MLAARGCRSVIAVEPNDDMREQGAEVNRNARIEWRSGTGEQTGLAAESLDLLSMASSFHWVDFELGTREFARVLRPGGRFVAIWNPRLIEANPLLAEIESQLRVLCPSLERVSSGRSGITNKLTELLVAHPDFTDVVYMEGRHLREQTVEEYIGAWRSVNDVQFQLGPEKFAEFLDYVRRRLHDVPAVQTTYLTRAWAARRC
jgi:SAM-dependent methyltransferase